MKGAFLSKKLFLILLLLLPINLGKHFILKSSYVGGILMGYLVPTLYVQDILIILILFFWIFFEGGIRKCFEKKVVSKPFFIFLTYYLFSILLSVYFSTSLASSLSAFFKIFLYSCLCIYILVENSFSELFNKITKIMYLDVCFLGLLGIFQYIFQRSVFNSYLVLGEQPYSVSTPGIATENILGSLRVPSYGLFLHPNVFGGFLSIVLIWLVYKAKCNKLFFIPVFLGALSLIFTFSYTSWLAFIFGVALLYTKKKFKRLIVIFAFVLCTVSLFIPLINSHAPSLFRRSAFLLGSYKIIKDKPLFGVGLNSSTYVLERYLPYTSDIRFVQPVHNIFILVLSESGVFALLSFLLLLFISLKKSVNSVVFVSLLQVLVLGSFDHYLITIHQTNLLMWIILGMVWTISTHSPYNLPNEKDCSAQ